MRRLLVITAVITLAGCAHQPLMTSCITKEQLRELESQEPEKISNRLHGKADEDIRIVTGSALKLRAWSHNLLDALKVCTA